MIDRYPPSAGLPRFSFARALVLASVVVSCINAARANPPASRPTTSPATRFAIDPVLMQRVDAAINQAIDQHQIPGAVLLVGRADQTLYLKAYGARALQPERIAMTPDTIFDMASCTKPIATATSIMILVERGKIKVADPVAKYLPAFAANGKEAITIEQLMMHTSGLIPDNPMSDYQGGPAAAMEKILALKPQRPAGQRFSYSDMNYIVLGEVVRAVDGRPLDQFAREEIFQPLAMKDSTFNPPDALKARCAPAEKRGDHWMLGEVHDPRSFALGGVAGHAGLFATAEDIARYCRMILHLGQLDGNRILSEATVRLMTQPRPLPVSGTRSLGFDIDTGYSGCRGTRFTPIASFGHTGFTGTMFWIDSATDAYIVLLACRVHPNGGGDVGPLRRTVSTLAAEAMLGPVPTTAPAAPAAGQVLCGIDVLEQDHFKLLEGRNIALVTNQTGRDLDGNRTVDLLLAAKNLKLVRLLSPEHGLFGLVDAAVKDAVDPKTGLKVYSLYGQTNRPTDEMLEGIDTLVYDIQDVGARFYTYSVTLGYCMEAAARKKIRMVVLDRPNPITGLLVDGPLADKDELSFIAYGPLPIAHGMTFGELARLYNAEFKVNCDLTVVQMRNWRRSMWFDQTGLLWTNPSPNMRNLTQATLYTGVCLLEASNVSVGRGTDQPFEVFGAPWIDARRLAAALNDAQLPGLRFVPIEFTPTSAKFASQLCRGVYIIVTDRNAVRPVRAGLAIAFELKELFGDKFQIDAVGHLLGNKAALAALKSATDLGRLAATWEADLEQFKATREKYLIYR